MLVSASRSAEAGNSPAASAWRSSARRGSTMRVLKTWSSWWRLLRLAVSRGWPGRGWPAGCCGSSPGSPGRGRVGWGRRRAVPGPVASRSPRRLALPYRGSDVGGWARWCPRRSRRIPATCGRSRARRAGGSAGEDRLVQGRAPRPSGLGLRAIHYILIAYRNVSADEGEYRDWILASCRRRPGLARDLRPEPVRRGRRHQQEDLEVLVPAISGCRD